MPKKNNVISVILVLIALTFYPLLSNANLEDYDIEKQYDIDYSGGRKSLYNKRFGITRIIPREENVITNSFKNIQKKLPNNTDQIRILDFGSGDGRMFPVIENLAKQYPSRSIELIAYDISTIGLSESIQYLEDNGYVANKKRIKLKFNIKETYIVGFWKKDNLTVKIVHGNKMDDLEHIKFLIEEPIHLTLSIFSVLGHISGRDNRQATIKMLAGLMNKNGELIINVSTPTSLPTEIIAYQTLRQQYDIALKHKKYNTASAIKATLGKATEPGDLYYCKSDGVNSTYSYGHAYTGIELQEDIKQANLIPGNVNVMSVEQPYVVSSNILKKFYDTILSMFLSIDFPLYPFNSRDELSKSIYVVAHKKID